MGEGSKVVTALLVIVIATSFMTSICIAAETKLQPAEAAKPSPDALEFLRACCNTTQTEYVKVCYDSLLPHAESIHGNHIKIVIAATNNLVTHLQSYLSELRHLNSTTEGYSLNDCMKFADTSINLCKEWLPKLERLDAIGNGKLDEHAISYLKKWLRKMEVGFGECSMDTGNILNISEVLPSESTIDPFLYIIEAFLNGIPSTGAIAPTSA
ncbi:hypothetical protein QOZ80_1BG0084600 [Eleusine coracana subsp. coracana]|nr:hypothetical protein QOZ80_1BG0084600 [Eleusine coracana subsp. coracana]